MKTQIGQVPVILLFLVLLTAIQPVLGQNVTVSGSVKKAKSREALPFVNVIVQVPKDSSFVLGTVSNEEGRFSLSPIKTGKYLITYSYVGFKAKTENLEVGRLSDFLDLGNILLEEYAEELGEVIVQEVREEVESGLDRKIYAIDENISQLGGSVLQSLQNLPGITIDQNGTVSLRGSNKVAILLDGKQTAITGIGAQSGLENFPASSIERIEIINNPS